jgi:hypothetical protein
MRYTHTTTWEIQDVPAEVAAACQFFQVPLTLKKRFDGGQYRLRLYTNHGDVDLEKYGTAVDPDEFTGEVARHWAVLSHSDYDGGYNFDGLGWGRYEGLALLKAYGEAQRELYPELAILIDPWEDGAVEPLADFCRRENPRWSKPQR